MKKEEPKFISLAEAAKLTNYSQDYISLLCRQGKLRAEKLGRNWVTTKEWVYSYVDNTEGKGESVVPVRVKADNESKEPKEAKVEKKEKKRKAEPFYGQWVLEGAFFCFACLIWSINIFLFISCWRNGDFGSGVFATADSYSVSGASDGNLNNAGSCGAQGSGDSNDGADILLSFDKETDASVAQQRTAEIKAALGQDVDAEIYSGFAVVAYKDSPEKKFLYVFE